MGRGFLAAHWTRCDWKLGTAIGKHYGEAKNCKTMSNELFTSSLFCIYKCVIFRKVTVKIKQRRKVVGREGRLSKEKEG